MEIVLLGQSKWLYEKLWWVGEGEVEVEVELESRDEME